MLLHRCKKYRWGLASLALAAAVLPLSWSADVVDFGGRTLGWSVGTGTGVVRPVSIQPTATGAGPLTFDGHVVTFAGTPDPTVGFGYNQTPGGTPVVAGEPGIRFQVEGNYNDGSGSNKVEAYLQYLSTDGTTTIRPFFYQFNRSTNTLVAAQHLGPLQIYDSASTSTNWYQFNKNQLITNGADNDTSFLLNAPSGKNAAINLSRNAASATLQILTSNDNLAELVYGSAVLWFSNRTNGTNGSSGAISVGVQDTGAIGTFSVGTSHAGTKGLVARARSGQTASLFEAQDSSSVAYWKLDKVGRPITANTTPTIAAGTGAGTGPTMSISGTDVAGTITITTGTIPAASATVATITFSTAYGAAPNAVIVTDAGANSAALSGTNDVYEDKASRAAGSFVLKVGAGGLAATTTYLFNYQVGG